MSEFTGQADIVAAAIAWTQAFLAWDDLWRSGVTGGPELHALDLKVHQTSEALRKAVAAHVKPRTY